MNRREKLHNLLISLMGTQGDKISRVYFQPPESLKMEYPAIVYSRSDIRNDYAGNEIHAQKVAYSLTVIDKDPDSVIVSKVAKLPYCRFNRHFTTSNLNHDTFTIYY